MTTTTDLSAAIQESGNLLPAESDAELLELPSHGFHQSFVDRVSRLPWWVISTTVHAALFVLASLLIVAAPRPKQQESYLIISRIVEPVRKFETRKKPRFSEAFSNDKTKIQNTRIKKPLTDPVDRIPDHINPHVEEPIFGNKAGLLGAGVGDIPLGSGGKLKNYSVGPEGCLPFDIRRPNSKSKERALQRFDADPRSEMAVNGALRWLARHQQKDGGWKYGADAKLRKHSSTAMTGLSTLAFLGAGHTHKAGRYRETVKRAVKYLKDVQHKDGLLGQALSCGGDRRSHGRVGYTHAMGAMALVEAYGMSGDYKLKQPAQRSVDYSIEHQNPGGGWRYKSKTAGDISVTGWFVMQLKSAKLARLKVPASAYHGGMIFVDSLLGNKTGKSVYVLSQAGSRNYMGKGPQPKTAPRRTAISMVCRLFMGVPRNEEVMKLSAKWLQAGVPDWTEQKDFYYWYYATLAMFQCGGDNWKIWNKALKPTLVNNQRRGGPLDGSVKDVEGSWDYTGDRWADDTKPMGGAGRVFTTALGALCLEVYYRYLPMYGK
jgi:Squalene-hopene cyclase C-terminal domain